MKTTRVLNRIDEQGNLIFDLNRELAIKRYKQESLWLKPVMMIFILLVCAVADFVSIWMLFNSFLYENLTLRMIAVAALLIGLDVGPIYLGLNVRKLEQGYQIKRSLIFGFIFAFVLAAAVNFILRIVTKDLAFPDFSNLSATPTFSNSFFYAICFAILPIITSIVSFLASYTMANPLCDELKKLDFEKIELEECIGKLNAVMREYEVDADFLNRLLQSDLEKYNASYGMIKMKHKSHLDYVRERFNEQLGEPAEISRPVAIPRFQEEDLI